jgi:hypothetical protein
MFGRTRALVCALMITAAVPAVAAAHVERSGYWPDPAPDCSITPCAGGAVPEVRSLASALDPTQPGRTRVVCQPDSLDRLKASIERALVNGYDVRPTDHRTFSEAEADELLLLNRRLFAQCRYDEIQPAVMDSGNHDRVVIMPGLYPEPTARSQPTHDPACDPYQTRSDSGDPGALSHAYQVHCPNDANLVAVIGRDIGPKPEPETAPADRHGIPNPGSCIRCNLQMEGSGVSADDVVIEAGDPAAGNGGPSAVGHAKDVGVFIDRADGFVLRGVTVRHAREHDIYAMETDGYRLTNFKTYYAGGYGVLTFVEDHGLIEHCDTAGSGDSGLYPGAGAKTSAGRNEAIYPEFRYSQEIRFCDSRHNTGGFSGTNGNANWVHHNNFYDNALGFTTDVFTAPGHPGFPQQGDLIEHNNFYDNNFNPFVPTTDVPPSIPAPVGTGLWIAGGNDNVLRNNRFYDNYRRGVMLFAVPDATVCGPVLGSTTPVPGCDPLKTTTSYDNRFHDNQMGVSPAGLVRPNGVDFWWDSFPGNTGNCWWGNTGATGGAATSSPPVLPDCLGGSVPALSVGTGYAPNEAELVACLAGFETGGYPHGDQRLCDWTRTPARPAASGRRAPGASSAIVRARRRHLAAMCTALPGNHTCAPVATAARAAGAKARRTPAKVTFEGAWARRPLGLYTCRDWRRAGPIMKRRLLARLARWTGGPVHGDALMGYGTVLKDRHARRLFDAECGHRYARAFLLYKVYGQAAGFAGVAP